MRPWLARQLFHLPVIIIVLGALSVVVFWGISAPLHAASRSGLTPTCPDCNVVFVSFDTLRADYHQLLPQHRSLTPTLDQLAEHGTTFTQAVSASSWTLPSTMSWWTGVAPSRHHITNKYLVGTPDEAHGDIRHLKRLSPELVTLAEVLRGHGYQTGGFTGGAAVHRQFGFDQGFDTYVDDINFGGFHEIVPRALAWITAHQHEKLFIFLHGYDCHGQYVPPGGLDHRYTPHPYHGSYTGTADEQRALREEGLEKGRLYLSEQDVAFWRGLYAEKVERADAEFAQFLQAYRALGLMERTVFVITSDHGEELMEHGRLDHGPTLYEEIVRVPLLIVIPGLEQRTIDRQVRAIDLMPTLLSLVGITPSASVSAQLQGRNILGADETPTDARIETEYRYYTFLKGLREAASPHWKLILNQETHIPELFNLTQDSQEQHNARTRDPKETTRLLHKLLAP